LFEARRSSNPSGRSVQTVANGCIASEPGYVVGRTWWAHFEFTRMNIEPIILRKQIEERRILDAFCVAWRS